MWALNCGNSLRGLARRRRQGKPEATAAAVAFVVSPVAPFLAGQSPQTGCCTDHDLGGRMIERVRAVLATPDGCLLAVRRDRPGQVWLGVGMSENAYAFPSEGAVRLGCYVCRLLDPRNGETFYVGKGHGNRLFDHHWPDPARPCSW
jgi:hypothetical protein